MRRYWLSYSAGVSLIVEKSNMDKKKWLWLFLQDSDWEEVDAEDAEVQQSFLHASPAKLSGKPDYEHLAAMAKVFEVLFSQFFFKC